MIEEAKVVQDVQKLLEGVLEDYREGGRVVRQLWMRIRERHPNRNAITLAPRCFHKQIGLGP